MNALSGKARTAETYIAGFGASGALVAGAIVAFLLLIGAVTFNAWPQASGLFGGGGSGIEAVDVTGPADSAAAALGPAADQVAPAQPGDSLAGGGSGSGGDQGAGGGSGGSGGGSGGNTGGGTDGGSAPSGTGADGGSAVAGGSGGDPVGGLGQTVDNTVQGVGETVNNTVNGLGQTVNNTVNGVNNTVNGLLGGGQ